MSRARRSRTDSSVVYSKLSNTVRERLSLIRPSYCFLQDKVTVQRSCMFRCNSSDSCSEVLRSSVVRCLMYVGLHPCTDSYCEFSHQATAQDLDSERPSCKTRYLTVSFFLRNAVAGANYFLESDSSIVHLLLPADEVKVTSNNCAASVKNKFTLPYASVV